MSTSRALSNFSRQLGAGKSWKLRRGSWQIAQKIHKLGPKICKFF
jgi:hypothetical protein